MTLKRTAFWCGAGLSALLGVAAVAVALAVYRPQLVRPWLQRALTPRGGTASLATLRLSLAPPTLELSGLTIAGPPREGALLRLDHLRFELIPRSFLYGGPWLRHVAARGLVFERPRPPKKEGPPDLTVLKRLFDIEDLSVTDARLRVALTQGDLAAEGIRLSLIPGERGIRRFRGDAELTFLRKEGAIASGRFSARGDVMPGPAIEVDLTLTPARLMLPQLAGDMSGRTKLRVTPKTFHAEELTLTLTRGQVRLDPNVARTFGPIRLNADASGTLEVTEPRLEVRALDIGGLILARGRVGGSTLEEMSGSLEGEIPRVEDVKAFLAPLLPGPLTGIDLAGRLPYRIRLSAPGTARTAALELFPRDLRFAWPRTGFDCRFGGTLWAGGPLEGWNLGKTAVEWNLSAGAGNVFYKERPLPLGALDVRGAAEATADSFRAHGISIRSDFVGRLTGELAYLGGRLSGSLRGAGLPADNLASLARTLTGGKWEGWSATGAVDVAARLEPAPAGSRIAATAALGAIGFASPTGDAMGRNLAGAVNFEALLTPRPRMKADLVLRRGEALWGTVFVDFGGDPLDLRAQATRAAPDEYVDLALEGGLSGFGRVRIDGKARRAGRSWRHQGRLALRDARLGPIFRTFLRDPLAARRGDLAGLEMDGIAEATVSFSGTGQAADLAGRLRLSSGELRRGTEPPLLSGLDIDLPIAYSLGAVNPGLPRPSEASRWGRVSLANLRVAGQELGPLEMPAVLVPNRLYLGGAIDASFFGADLHVRRIQVDEPLSPGFRINLSARLDGLDLARAAGDNSVLQGRLGGILDPVLIDRERMTAAGELTGVLYGGRLHLRNVTVEHPFDPGREIGADVNLSRIDLDPLSAALGVGRITGRLSGSVEGLRVAYGQPVAFHLRMESVPAEGVRQSVSLKAVNSISVVSTGSALSGLGASIMTTFFREFPYEKIGVECVLKNDVFSVRGLIHEDGVEYLVKRRSFAGINVINRNPDNRIGFTDMVERAKRATSNRSD